MSVLLAAPLPALAQQAANRLATDWPACQESDHTVSNYKFTSGESLPEVKLHSRTIGTAKRNADGRVVNGVQLLQGNTGTGANWFRASLADELFKPGQPLDAAKYYSIVPDALGRLLVETLRWSESRISARPLPRHGRPDAPSGHRRVEGRPSTADHLQLSGVHAAVSVYPDLMDGTLGMSCQPVEISGRNYLLRHGAAELIRHDPTWHDGAITTRARRFIGTSRPATT